MRYSRILFFWALFIVFVVDLSGCAKQAESEWKLVWQDEFSDTVLDQAKWRPETSCWGGGNEERQCYTDRLDNIEVADGVLRLKAKAESFTGNEFPEGHPAFPGKQISKSYTSGKVRTLGLADWTYGRFEARMKLPTGQGTWSAFWMMPANNVYGKWAASGEIDIVEAVNLGAVCTECKGGIGENRSLGALHYGGIWPNNTHQANFNPLPGGANALNKYHVFAVEWGEGRISWFVDDIKFSTINAENWYSGTIGKDTHPNAPFDQDFYLMLNLAVGGKLAEENNDKGFVADNFPAEVLVDWVRVYQCESDSVSGRRCMDGG